VAALIGQPLRTWGTFAQSFGQTEFEVIDNPDGEVDSFTVTRNDAAQPDMAKVIEYVFDSDGERAFAHGFLYTDGWELLTQDEIVRGDATGASSIEDVVSGLSASFLTPDLVAQATSVEAGDVVVVDGEPARQYRLSIDPVTVTAPSFVSATGAVVGADGLVVEAYVTPDDRLVLTTVRLTVGGEAGVFVLHHRVLTESVPITLPPLEQIVDEQSFS
jgi:hypothetical protein